MVGCWDECDFKTSKVLTKLQQYFITIFIDNFNSFIQLQVSIWVFTFISSPLKTSYRIWVCNEFTLYTIFVQFISFYMKRNKKLFQLSLYFLPNRVDSSQLNIRVNQFRITILKNHEAVVINCSNFLIQ